MNYNYISVSNEDKIMELGENSNKFGTLANLSATGANLDLPGFTSDNLDRHFGSGNISDHSHEYVGFTKVQYAEKALKLARSPVGDGIEGYKSTYGKSKGSIVRYDTSTGDWVRAWSTGVATMFKPVDGALYFERKNEAETRSV